MGEMLGMIGLGKMGLPLSRQMMADGHEIVGYDIDPARMKMLEEEGGRPAASAQEVAEQSDITFSILLKPEHIEETRSARKASSPPERRASFTSK